MKNSFVKISISLIFFLLMITCPCDAENYYVDQNHQAANDSNPGSIDSPWITIQHAAENAVAGDTVFVRSGISHESVYFENSGNSTQGFIVFSIYQGEQPTIDGTGVSDMNNGLVLDKSYIKLLGFKISNWNDNGIWIEQAAHFEIADCEVFDVYYGIGVGDDCSDFEFNRVLVHHFDLYGFDVTSSLSTPSSNGIFNECISHTGRDPQQNVDGFALGHGEQHDFVLNNCVAHDVYDGFDISSRQSTLNGCLAYNCSNGAYKLWQDEVKLFNCIGHSCETSIVELDWDNQPGKTTLMNCTFFDSKTYTIWIENAADQLEMYNCILSGGDNIGLAFEQMGVTNYMGDYNVFQNDNPNRVIAVGYTDEFTLKQVESGNWTTYSGKDAHSITVDNATKIFLDLNNLDLHFCQNSPAIDIGTSSNAPSTDFDGNPRPTGAGFDIGAY